MKRSWFVKKEKRSKKEVWRSGKALAMQVVRTVAGPMLHAPTNFATTFFLS
jgi:hypothetical protein